LRWIAPENCPDAAPPPSVTTSSPEETAALARGLANLLKPEMVVCIQGALGAGKSVLARALGAALGVEDPMPSPTFTIINEYSGYGNVPVLHADLYRISGAEEYIGLALEDLMDGAITLVEWPERAGTLLLSRASLVVTVSFPSAPAADDERTVQIEWQNAHSRD
jgi:tRNA threonylcarbamoyladenosine biosynthesis protein TsaE